MRIILIILMHCWPLFVFGETFEVKFKDQDGKEWSQVLGTFRHCSDWNGDCGWPLSPETSPAVKACHDIGGDLPTKYEWRRFITSFKYQEHHGYIGVLESKFFKTFDELGKKWKYVYFWTSTIYDGPSKPNGLTKRVTIHFRKVKPTEKYELDNFNVLIWDETWRNNSSFVRCIRRP